VRRGVRFLAALRLRGDPPSRWMVVRKVPVSTPRDLHDPAIDAYKQWKPEYQAKALEALRQAENQAWRPFFCPDSLCNGHAHVKANPRSRRRCGAPNGHIWETTPAGRWGCITCGVDGEALDDWLWEHARVDQRPPRWPLPWQNWLMSGGRGSGKTRAGSETTHKATLITPRITLIAATGPDLRETMVEGRSGLLATAKPGSRPVWEPSRKRLTWPNGCVAQGFSAEEPDRLRGPESGFVWADEPAHYPLVDEVWSMMEFGLRIKDAHGRDPKVVATSTPKPTPWMKARVKEEITIVHRVSSYFNAQNLAESFKRNVIGKHEGTRLGAQEIYGEVLEDVEGALWNYGLFTYAKDAPVLDRIVVSVDPAGSTDARADDTGIVVMGRKDDLEFVLADLTGKFTPDVWGKRVWQAVSDYSVDAIVAEKNYGGNMVKHVLETTKPKDLDARIQLVNSRHGKKIRAEPVVARYEQHRVVHVGERGDLHDLEDEQTSWVPGEGPSPNRVDALVHGSTALVNGHGVAQVSSPARLVRRTPVPRHLRVV